MIDPIFVNQISTYTWCSEPGFPDRQYFYRLAICVLWLEHAVIYLCFYVNAIVSTDPIGGILRGVLKAWLSLGGLFAPTQEEDCKRCFDWGQEART